MSSAQENGSKSQSSMPIIRTARHQKTQHEHWLPQYPANTVGCAHVQQAAAAAANSSRKRLRHQGSTHGATLQASASASLGAAGEHAYSRIDSTWEMGRNELAQRPAAAQVGAQQARRLGKEVCPLHRTGPRVRPPEPGRTFERNIADYLMRIKGVRPGPTCCLAP